MRGLSFDWDEKKNTLNRKKHGISFEEAQTIFADENALLIHDPDHSLGENRFILIAYWFKPKASRPGCLSLP